MKGKEEIRPELLSGITGGTKKQEKYVSAFYCEYCGRTIHLNMVYSLERAVREHNKSFHSSIR